MPDVSASPQGIHLVPAPLMVQYGLRLLLHACLVLVVLVGEG